MCSSTSLSFIGRMTKRSFIMKKRIVAALVAVVMIVGCVCAFAACQPSELIGFDVDLAKAVAQELGVEVEFQLISWDAKETELESKSIDLIWNGLTITDEREEAMEISTPYLNNKQVAVIKKSNADKYTTAESMKDATVTFENGSAGADVAKAQGFKNQVGASSQMMALTDVLSGSSDVVILDSVLANFYCNADSKFSELMIVPNLVFVEETYGIAARKGDVGTIDKINTALSALQANGKLAEIAKTYGLESELCDVTYTSKWNDLTAEQKSGWEELQKKGKIVIGYTVYAPIAYTA